MPMSVVIITTARIIVTVSQNAIGDSVQDLCIVVVQHVGD